MKYKATTIAVAVHPENENPIYGDSVIHVLLEDEAAGAFIVLEQNTDDTVKPRIRVELEELELIVETARRIINGSKV